MQTPIRQKRPNFRILFLPLQMPPPAQCRPGRMHAFPLFPSPLHLQRRHSVIVRIQKRPHLLQFSDFVHRNRKFVAMRCAPRALKYTYIKNAFGAPDPPGGAYRASQASFQLDLSGKGKGRRKRRKEEREVEGKGRKHPLEMNLWLRTPLLTAVILSSNSDNVPCFSSLRRRLLAITEIARVVSKEISFFSLFFVLAKYGSVIPLQDLS